MAHTVRPHQVPRQTPGAVPGRTDGISTGDGEQRDWAAESRAPTRPPPHVGRLVRNAPGSRSRGRFSAWGKPLFPPRAPLRSGHAPATRRAQPGSGPNTQRTAWGLAPQVPQRGGNHVSPRAPFFRAAHLPPDKARLRPQHATQHRDWHRRCLSPAACRGRVAPCEGSSVCVHRAGVAQERRRAGARVRCGRPRPRP
jgi:hypothetical protein